MKPILFNTKMVQAILDARKAVTRRVVKPQPKERFVPDESDCYIYRGIPCGLDGMTNLAPYRPGDILYVRETWAEGAGGYEYKADHPASDGWGWRPSIHMPCEAARIFLRVTGVRVEQLQKMEAADFKAEGILPKRPKELPGHGCDCARKHDRCLESPCANHDAYEYLCWMDAFLEVWDSTIKPTDRALYSWAANPWVWVIEFERISKEEAMAHDGNM